MATTKTNYWKWIILAAAGAALFFGGWECHRSKVIKSGGTVKIVTKDSIVYQDRPVPYKIDSLVFVKGKDGKIITLHDTLETFEVRIDPADTVAILKGFYETAYYKTEVDTGRAKITILDTVTQNRLKGQSVKVVFSDTTTTITKVLMPPKNIVLSFTGSLLGNFRNPLYGQGGGLQLKLPNDASYQFQIFVIDKHRPMMQFTKTFPIRFKK